MTLSRALAARSPLRGFLQPGLKALGSHADRVVEGTARVADSLDFDEATRAAHPSASRWDYFLGVASTSSPDASKKRAKSARGPSRESIIAVEVHSATDGEVRAVIAKKNHSRPVLLQELRPGRTVARWVWITSGKSRISPDSKYTRQLAAARIEFVGSRLQL